MTIDEAIKICEEDAEKIGGNPQSDRHAERCRQLAEWLTELKEAKQLLKVAVNDIQDILHYANSISVCFHCVHRIDTCYRHPACKDRAEWEHLEEALKLIGEDKEE